VIDDSALHQLEESVAAALRNGDTSTLPVIGAGEISVVLGYPPERPEWVCKRLPPFSDRDRADRYGTDIDRYVAELTARGVDVLPTTLRRVDRDDGTAILYCLQPAAPSGDLAVATARAHPQRVEPVIEQIVNLVRSTVDADIGLDAQLSNWVVVGDRVTYFDVTTPLMRGDDGRPLLDTGVLVASLPWILRPPVHRWVVPGILARYHDPRTVVLDLAANLVKERLDHLIPVVLAASAEHFQPPLTDEEVRRDYRSDARTWAALQYVRRADRAWQRHVRRRSYPFLLPKRIER
jgi:hypothetical protein